MKGSADPFGLVPDLLEAGTLQLVTPGALARRMSCGARARMARRMARQFDRAARSVSAQIELDAYGRRGWTARDAASLHVHVADTWCGGDQSLAHDAFAAAYLSYLPWKLRQNAVRLAAVLVLGAAWWVLLLHSSLHWVFEIPIGVVLVLASLLTALILSGPPRRLLATVLPGPSGDGLLSESARQRFWSWSWRSLPARALDEQSLRRFLTGGGEADAVVETALALHEDGWDGSNAELLAAARAL